MKLTVWKKIQFGFPFSFKKKVQPKVWGKCFDWWVLKKKSHSAMSSAEAAAELGDDSCRKKYRIFMAATIQWKSIAALADHTLYVFVLWRLRKRLESESVTQRSPAFMKKGSISFPFLLLSVYCLIFVCFIYKSLPYLTIPSFSTCLISC